MNRLLFTIMAALVCAVAGAQSEAGENAYNGEETEAITLTYQHGTILLKDNIARLTIPKGFKYLDAKQAERVLVEYWGNPYYEGMTLGFILREEQDAVGYSGYIFNIEFYEIGYVDDRGADELNADDLYKQLSDDISAGNEMRARAGYQTVELKAWASRPFFDKEKRTFSWAKELSFGDDEENTLNYSIRVLGRKGMLMLDAIAPISELGGVKADVPAVLNMIEFTEGNRYSDYNAGLDKVSAWTVGDIILGQMIEKSDRGRIVGMVWKLLVACVLGICVYLLYKRIKATEEKERMLMETETDLEEEEEKDDGESEE
jgi:uncharacterized membrane-anchored protein